MIHVHILVYDNHLANKVICKQNRFRYCDKIIKPFNTINIFSCRCYIYFLLVMARGSQLSEYEKGRIDEMRTGNSIRFISRILGRSHNVVLNYLRNPVLYGTKKGIERPSKLSSREKRRIIHKASNSIKSAAQIRAECSLNVSTRIILRTIHEAPFIRKMKINTAPMLKKDDKAKRLQFARNNMDRKWTEVKKLNFLSDYINISLV